MTAPTPNLPSKREIYDTEKQDGIKDQASAGHFEELFHGNLDSVQLWVVPPLSLVADASAQPLLSGISHNRRRNQARFVR
jgi:hypothetical protein